MNLVRAALSRGRGIWSGLSRAVLILVYHRVERVEVDPWELSVSPDHFGQHVELIKRHGWPLSLRDLVRALRGDSLPRRAVVITLDDGYVDNLLNAEPLLSRHDVPATCFVAAGLLGRKQSFWWDELGDLLLRPGVLPSVLELLISGKNHKWSLGSDCNYKLADQIRDHRWRPWKPSLPTGRHALYLELFSLLRPLPEPGRERAMSDLRRLACRAHAEGAERDRPLSHDEARRLARKGLVEIGAHTVTHPRLSDLDPDSQRREIADSRTLLEETIGGPVTSFAYPYGQRGDYGAATADLVREAGFQAACSNSGGRVTSACDLFELPRHHVSDCDGEEFERRMRRWWAEQPS